MGRSASWLALLLALGCGHIRPARVTQSSPGVDGASTRPAERPVGPCAGALPRAHPRPPTVAANSQHRASSADPRAPEPVLSPVAAGGDTTAAIRVEPAPPADEHPAGASARDLLSLSAEQLEQLLAKEPSALGSLSVGRPNAGKLIGGVQMPAGEHYKLMAPGGAWGTQETIDYLVTAIDKVNAEFPSGTHALRIGHLSAHKGGRLYPHRSHQSGRDVDVSYYYRQPAEHLWYRRAGAGNLDLARTWAFVRALVTETDVEMIFMSSRIQRLLKHYALGIGEDPEWLDGVFQYGSRHPAPIVRHAWGHDTHLHVRFFNPVAQTLAARAYPALVAHKLVAARHDYLRYRARRGDLLSRLAKRFGTTVRALQQSNALHSTRILAGAVYLIPRKSAVASPREPVIPPRRLPPEHSATLKGALAAPDRGGAG